MNELATLVKELEEQLIVCTRCGMCQSVCPLFEQTLYEADVARGKLALLSGLMTHLFFDPDGVNKRLNKCLLCGSCAANCPSGVNVLEIFIKARAILTEYQGLSFIKKIIFNQVLSNPPIFNILLVWAEKFQKIMAKNNKNIQGTSCARLVSPLLSHRHFMPIAKEPFHKSLGTLKLDSKMSSIKVAFFTGCLIDKIMPHIAHASVKALLHSNVDLVIPETQGCCGIPALASGDRKTFDSLVKHHVNLFQKEKFDYLVTACATCTSTIKKLWPSLYQGKETSFMKYLDDLSKKTMDINQFIVDVMQIGSDETDQDKKFSETVTYHDPCHLKKSLNIFTQPRQVITASGKYLKEMEGADKCCGMGGSFNLFYYDISSKIGKLKQDNITDTNCSIVASGCPACIMQISDMLSKAGSNIQVKHSIEIYADSLEESQLYE
ncbi:(Fe-S)-binding protein [Desulfobacula sp.]|uniref:(Fe-S)-binding protein n=1 Tax=Desulfobacula sp. TaxID=2593537 RepID=UPI0025B7F66F|nr:(Fe-S)-binding protein [Desulfobacula sp.]